MSTVLSGMQRLKCLVYLDDIIVFGETLKLHNIYTIYTILQTHIYLAVILSYAFAVLRIFP